MKNKRIYPIGYLLKILHISYTDLAKAIYIDRTVVNKWALGKRKFNSHSAHYQKVVDYLIEMNNKGETNLLKDFFDKLYPNVVTDESSLRTCINKYLNESNSIANIGGRIVGQSDHVLHYTAPISKTTFGRFAALLDLLDKTLSVETKQEIILYDSQQFAWLTEDEYYGAQFKTIILKVLKKGHLVTLISEVDYMKHYYQFVGFIETFYPFSNFKEYYYISNNNPEVIYSYYLVKGERAVIGNRLLSNELYTISLSDPYSVDSCEAKMIHHLKNCILHKPISNEKDRNELIDLMQVVQKTNDLCFIYTVGLSFITMSQELLEDVLKTNQIYGIKRQRILDLKNSHEIDVYNKEVKEVTFRQMCYLQDIKDSLNQDKVYLLELALFAGKEIYLSHSQVVWHIEDTIQLLKSKKNYSLGFLRQVSSDHRTGYAQLCRKNQYFISCYEILRITREIRIVNSIVDIMEKEWDRNIPIDYKDNDKVAEKLSHLLEDEIKNNGIIE